MDHSGRYVTPKEIGDFLKFYGWTIGACIAAGVVAAMVYANQSPRLYTATVQLIIDPKMSAVPIREQATDVGYALDSALVESQLVMMKSETIATTVIDALDLRNDPDFQVSGGGLLTRWLALVRPAAEVSKPSDFERMRSAIGNLGNNVAVRRVGPSYIIEIIATSTTRTRAAPIANAVASAYVRDQLDSKSLAIRRGSEWLEERIQRLRSQMNAASRLVQAFKASHDYRIDVRRAGPSNETHAAAEGGDLREEQVTLEELETSAQTYRRIYDSFLQALTESAQRESFPIVGARVITAATDPLGPSYPRTNLIVVLGGLLGTLAGLGVAALRRIGDTTIRSGGQMRTDAAVKCLGELPRIGPARSEPRHLRAARKAQRTTFNEVAVAPFSAFSDALRRAKMMMRHSERGRLVRCFGLTSACPHEGKSTLASNLALMSASSGARTLLIDADLRIGALTQFFAPDAEFGLSDILMGKQDAGRVILPTATDRLFILPAPTQAAIAHVGDLFGSERMRDLIEALRTDYDIIILDLPPMTVVADALAVGPMLDGVVLVAQWAETPAALLGECVHNVQASETELLGAMLNRVAGRDASGYVYGAEIERSWFPTRSPGRLRVSTQAVGDDRPASGLRRLSH